MINPHRILVDIEKAKMLANHPDDVADLSWMTRIVQNYEALLVLKDNPAVASLVGSFRREVGEIYNKLNTQREMSQDERNYLFAKKEANEKFISLLGTDPTKQVQDIEKQLNSFIKRI